MDEYEPPRLLGGSFRRFHILLPSNTALLGGRWRRQQRANTEYESRQLAWHNLALVDWFAPLPIALARFDGASAFGYRPLDAETGEKFDDSVDRNDEGKLNAGFDVTLHLLAATFQCTATRGTSVVGVTRTLGARLKPTGMFRRRSASQRSLRHLALAAPLHAASEKAARR
jgi:hypothetical protein